MTTLDISLMQSLKWCLIEDDIIHVGDYIPISPDNGYLKCYVTDSDGENLLCEFDTRVDNDDLILWRDRSKLKMIVCPYCTDDVMREAEEFENSICDPSGMGREFSYDEDDEIWR